MLQVASKAKTDPEALTDEAWELVAEALHKGQIKLRDREAPMLLDADHIVRLLQWLAHRKGKALKFGHKLEDFMEGSDGGPQEV